MLKKARGRRPNRVIDNLTNRKINKEPLDLLLEKSIITEEEHEAGLYYRWLFTIKYGAVKYASSKVWEEVLPSSYREDSEEWRAKQVAKFNELSFKLAEVKALELLQSLIVYNQMPSKILGFKIYQILKSGFKALTH